MPSLHFALSLGCYRKFTRKVNKSPCGSKVAHADLVARVDENISQQSNPSTENPEHTVPSQQSRDSTSFLTQAGVDLSGDSLHAKDFPKKLPKSLESRGAVGQINRIELIFKNGTYSAVEGTLIPFIHPSKKK